MALKTTRLFSYGSAGQKFDTIPTGLKVKVLAGPCFSLATLENNLLSCLFPASKGHSHPLAYGRIPPDQ